MKRATVGHGGVCREVRRFRAAWLESLAKAIEDDAQGRFAEFGVRLAVVPIQISYLTEVGEGVELTLVPDDPGSWSHWGDFEADLEVRRRHRFSRDWSDVRSPDQVATWLRNGVEQYLAELLGANRRDH